MATETNKHLFWECNIVQSFWSQLGSLLKDNNITQTLDWYQICFGQYEIKNTLFNLCILVGKYFIYMNKMRNTEPRYGEYINYLRKIKDIEKHIAINKNKVAIHEQKWSDIHLN